MLKAGRAFQEEAMQKPQRLHSDHSDIDESFSDVFETHLTDWSYAITFGLRSVRAV